MKQIIGGVILSTAGLVTMLFRSKLVSDIVELNNKYLGYYKYGEAERKLGMRLALFFGLLLIGVGVMVLFGVLKLK